MQIEGKTALQHMANVNQCFGELYSTIHCKCFGCCKAVASDLRWKVVGLNA